MSLDLSVSRRGCNVISGEHVFPGSRRFVTCRSVVSLVDHCAAQREIWGLGEKVK